MAHDIDNFNNFKLKHNLIVKCFYASIFDLAAQLDIKCSQIQTGYCKLHKNNVMEIKNKLPNCTHPRFSYDCILMNFLVLIVNTIAKIVNSVSSIAGQKYILIVFYPLFPLYFEKRSPVSVGQRYISHILDILQFL